MAYKMARLYVAGNVRFRVQKNVERTSCGAMIWRRPTYMPLPLPENSLFCPLQKSTQRPSDELDWRCQNRDGYLGSVFYASFRYCQSSPPYTFFLPTKISPTVNAVGI